jgi:DNA-binding HxlR family transcriptional regulator
VLILEHNHAFRARIAVVDVVRSYGDPCGVARSLDVVGERWALLVVRELLLGPKRFADLRAGLGSVSANVLSQRLRELEGHGIVERRELGPPLRVHVYELTPWGRELEPVLLHFGRWGSRAPRPEGGRLGIDSMMLSIMAAHSAGGGPPDGQVYEIRVDDETFTAETVDGRLRLRRANADGPAATATTDATTLGAIMSGEATVAAAVSENALVLTGSPEAVQHLTTLLTGAA